MKILISNDDGYLAPGIVALANALAPIAEIVVVAPDSNRSGSVESGANRHTTCDIGRAIAGVGGRAA